MYPEKNANISKVIPSHFLFESNLLDCLQYHLMKSRADKREIHFSLQRNPIFCAEKSRNKHPHRLHIPSQPTAIYSTFQEHKTWFVSTFVIFIIFILIVIIFKRATVLSVMCKTAHFSKVKLGT